MATHSNVLAWRIPGMGEPGGLPSTGPLSPPSPFSSLPNSLNLCVFQMVENT